MTSARHGIEGSRQALRRPATPENARKLGAARLAAAARRSDPILPLTIYGPELSYFTGKIEGVLRFMELPYEPVTLGPTDMTAPTGVAQVPALELADGRWLTDSTPMIAWLDERYPEFEIIPRDPVLAFFSRLLEDYADEWLWRPAMHYRWDYPESANHVAALLVNEAARGRRIPHFLMRYVIRMRQKTLFTRGDGITMATWAHVEKIYLDTLAQLDTILSSRPYLLGTRPSLADFGFFGPMFRHFAMDPASARIMRETASSVFAWVARVWDARASVTQGELMSSLPDDWGPILDSVGSNYLPHLCANAEAWKAKLDQFDVEIEDVTYRRIRTSQYRVWCLEELQRHFEELPAADQDDVRARLEAHGCWDPLWRIRDTASGVDPERRAPFVGTGSMTGLPLKRAQKLYWRPGA